MELLVSGAGRAALLQHLQIRLPRGTTGKQANQLDQYYQGVIDGVVGKETRTALEKFQGDFNLKVTGTITPEVLDALKIVAQ
ncbi:peptidoglycan-binding protein [Sphingobium sp. Ant17]|uniref:peptidoglycan-binding protein n=1 Tax=Sphingobium sp. Ant17 TaxID=1461752 RepID=UPI0004470403|nr:peptidoglycan-binding protein [Sphingobium sp. Ant17]EXS70827.1 hypothetical protein BF95_13595 [Sphingobium sp. Ant17]